MHELCVCVYYIYIYICILCRVHVVYVTRGRQVVGGEMAVGELERKRENLFAVSDAECGGGGGEG